MCGLYVFLSARVRSFLDERGVTTAEYALLLALVVVVLISSLSALGATLQDRLQSIIDRLTGVGP
ncbi:MAG: Flp family type IVb pilin [Bacillota bacterium]